MVRLRRRNDEHTVVAAATSDIAPWGNDPDLRRVNTVAAVRECFEALGGGRKLAVCGLRAPEVVVRGFEFPALPPEETQGAVELETAQMCPFSMEDGVLDHQVIPVRLGQIEIANEDDKTRGFWVAAGRSLVEDKRQLVYEAGLECVLMDVDGLALLNCLVETQRLVSLPEDESARTEDPRNVVLDVGDAYTSIAIVDQVHRPFVRDVCPGGLEILYEMAREMHTPLDEVRAALLEDAYADMAPFARSLERACGRLLEEIVTTLRYYAAQNRSVRVDTMLVCGRFASARGFLELLAAKLPLEVVRWNPIGEMPRDIDPSGETVLEKAGPALTVAAGLAMRTI